MYNKYFTAFHLSLSEQLTYRFNFIVGRVRNIIILLLLYYVWIELTRHTGQFASFTREELITYVFLVNILRSFIFGSQSRRIASEINDGTFSSYLTKPVNHFLHFYARELAERLVLTFTAIIEVVILSLILDLNLLVPNSISIISLFLVSLFLAHVLYYILSYCISLLAFWSREAMGPRFLFEWLLEFASGAYFPLNIVSPFFFTILQMLPFMYLIFSPAMIYLDQYSALEIIFTQILWIITSGLLAIYIWQKGLRRYTGEGI